MPEIYDVVVAGAGPIGLFLACELGMRGVSVLVLERDPKPQSPWKSAPLGTRGMNTPTIESLYRRGLLHKFFTHDERPSSMEKTSAFRFGGHFAGISLDVSKLDLSRYKYRLSGPALSPGPTTIELVETTLTERAETLGVTILRGCGVNKIIAQDEKTVTVEAGEEGKRFRGRWLVACDGGRSIIRRDAGFSFEGTEATLTGYVSKCDLDRPEKLKPVFTPTENGMYIKGPGFLYLFDFDGGSFDRTQAITKEHLQDVLNRVTGTTDLTITELHLASTFTDRSKQATTYRKGRIILAGDSAHIHSPLGAQGLNLGLGDAMNLGWKLAATVGQESEPTLALASSSDDSPSPSALDLTLLNTYESERHPIAAWVLEWTRVQVLTLQPGLHGTAMKHLVHDLIQTRDGANLLIDRFWGLSQRYVPSDPVSDGEKSPAQSHELVGCSAPDFEFSDSSRLGPKLEGGKGLFVDFSPSTDSSSRLEGLITGEKICADKIDYVRMNAIDECGLQALLIRPDGIVAWVWDESDAQADLDALQHALEQWFTL